MEIPEFTEIQKQLSELINIVAAEKEERFPAQWYNDEECWKKKGGMSLSTYRSNRFYQCKGGIPDARVGGRKVWSRESVMEWAKITDNELEAYHQKYKTGARKR